LDIISSKIEKKMGVDRTALIWVGLYLARLLE
jgi:hypothetical protein